MANRTYGRHEIFLLVQRGDRSFVQFKMLLHHLWRRKRQPLIERNISVIAALEYLKKAQRSRSSILDIVPHGKGDKADIAGLKIEGARLARRSEYAHSCLPIDIILPFIGVRMPMQLSQPSGLELNERR